MAVPWRGALAVVGLSLAWLVGAEEIPVASPGEIASAARGARPGDDLVLADGEWRDVRVLFVGDGAEARPIVLRPRTPGGVTFRGDSILRIAGSHLVVDGFRFEGCDGGEDVIEFRSGSRLHARRCRLTNCAVIDCDPGEGGVGKRWISLYGVENVVDHCLTRGKTGEGATVVVWLGDGPARHRIERNHFAHRPRLGKNGGETIRVGDSSTQSIEAGVIVAENLFERCDGEAEIVSNKSTANVYRDNTFLECEGALTLRAGARCLVEGNFFLGRGRRSTGGVRVIGAGHRVWNNYFEGLGGVDTRAALCVMNGIPDSPPTGYHRVRDLTVAFNTFVGCAENIVIGYSLHGATLPPEGCVFANNIVVTSGAGAVREVTPMAASRGDGGSNLVWGAAVEEPARAGWRRVDPRLTRGVDGLWRPAPDSPAIGVAEGDFASVTRDIDGQPRGGRKDIGCDQTGDGRVTSRPLRPADVGPSWMGALQAPEGGFKPPLVGPRR